MELWLKDERELFFDLLYPRLSDTVVHRTVVVHGARGMGRTEFLKYLAYEAWRRYEGKVWAVQGHIDDLMTLGLRTKHPVKILVADDPTSRDYRRMPDALTTGYKRVKPERRYGSTSGRRG